MSNLAEALFNLQGGESADLVARLESAGQSLAAPQSQQLRFFRITSDTPTTSTTSTTSTSSTSSTTSTTSTTTSTTTPAPCYSRVWRGIPVDVQYDSSNAASPGAEGGSVYGMRSIVTIERLQDSVALFAPNSLALRLNDIVLAALINGNWFVLNVYTNCPQGSVTTTTTTTSTTTSTTTPP